MYRRIALLIATLMGVAVAGAIPSAAQADNLGCQLDYKINYQMSHTFDGDIVITNRGAALEGWTLEFTFPHAGQKVIAVPEGAWSQSGTQVTIGSVDDNATLRSGDSTTISFLGTYAKVNPIPSKATLNGAACSGLPTATLPPTVAITTPREETLPAPATFTINASSSDVDGKVTRVEFYNNRTPLGVDTEAPYSLTVKAAKAGLYHLVAVAYDDSGQFTHSEWKHLTILPPPITVTGTIVDGVEMGCMVLAADDDNLYELVAGDEKLPPVGSRVKVYGQVRNDWGSYCMQGEILEVLAIETLS